jgi:hypothetical protein
MGLTRSGPEVEWSGRTHLLQPLDILHRAERDRNTTRRVPGRRAVVLQRGRLLDRTGLRLPEFLGALPPLLCAAHSKPVRAKTTAGTPREQQNAPKLSVESSRTRFASLPRHHARINSPASPLCSSCLQAHGCILTVSCSALVPAPVAFASPAPAPPAADVP